jgi:hypothetical protein
MSSVFEIAKLVEINIVETVESLENLRDLRDEGKILGGVGFEPEKLRELIVKARWVLEHLQSLEKSN